MATPDTPQSSVQSLPRLEDAYEIGVEIGRGGMGIVYEATHRVLGRAVAVKKIFPHLMEEEEFLSRFLQEAAVIAQLNHPGILIIHDICRDELGIPCIVMERLEGKPLGELLKDQRRLPPGRAARIVARAAEAIAHAHDNGVIHRDIKPDNIMVIEEDRVKVMDFGLARSVTVKKTRRLLSFSVFDRPDRIYGSFQYMSPEHIDIRKVNERSDIYSLGIVLYHALTGRLPFYSTNPLEILSMHINRAALRPSTFDPAIDEALDLEVLHALEKDPNHRPHSARDWGNALLRAVGQVEPDSGVETAEVAAGEAEAPESRTGTEAEVGVESEDSGAPTSVAPSMGRGVKSGAGGAAGRDAAAGGGAVSGGQVDSQPGVPRAPTSTHDFAERLRRRRLRSLRRIAAVGISLAFLLLIGMAGLGYAFLRYYQRYRATPPPALVAPPAALVQSPPRASSPTSSSSSGATSAGTASAGTSAMMVAMARPLARKGQEALERGDAKLAAINFAKAIKYMPSLGEGYLGLAQAYARQDRIAEAKKLLEESLTSDRIVLPSDLRPLAELWLLEPDLMREDTMPLDTPVATTSAETPSAVQSKPLPTEQ